MSDLASFLLARIAEDEAVARDFLAEGEWQAWALDDHRGPTRDDEYAGLNIGTARVLAECAAKRAIIEFHESWPVLVEAPPTFDPVDSGNPMTMTYRASQQIAWLTTQEYRKRFGDEPPTAPMLRALATVYADHPDFREEWR